MTNQSRPLTPEEAQAGSEVEQEQAAAILEESEERVRDRGVAPDAVVEHRTSEEATPPAG